MKPFSEGEPGSLGQGWFHQKLNGTESQRTPEQVSCVAIELLDTQVFERGSWNVGPVGQISWIDVCGPPWSSCLPGFSMISESWNQLSIRGWYDCVCVTEKDGLVCLLNFSRVCDLDRYIYIYYLSTITWKMFLYWITTHIHTLQIQSAKQSGRSLGWCMGRKDSRFYKGGKDWSTWTSWVYVDIESRGDIIYIYIW